MTTLLGRDLTQLEAVDPQVRRARKRYDAAIEAITWRAQCGVPRRRFRKSTGDQPVAVELTR